jgi:hypothetical protein
MGGILLTAGLPACGGRNWEYQVLRRDSVRGDLVSVECDGGQSYCHKAAARACAGAFTVEDSSKQAKDHAPGSMLVRCEPRRKQAAK